MRRAFVVLGSRLPGPMVLGSGFLDLGSRFLDPSALVSGSRFSRFRVFKGFQGFSRVAIVWPLDSRFMVHGSYFTISNR